MNALQRTIAITAIALPMVLTPSLAFANDASYEDNNSTSGPDGSTSCSTEAFTKDGSTLFRKTCVTVGPGGATSQETVTSTDPNGNSGYGD